MFFQFQLTCLLSFFCLPYVETVSFINRFYWEKYDVFAFILGTINTELKNNPKDCDESGDREILTLSEEEPATQDKESGMSSVKTDVFALTSTAEDKEWGAGFQGRWACPQGFPWAAGEGAVLETGRCLQSLGFLPVNLKMIGQHLVWVPCKVPCAFQEASSCRHLGVFTQPYTVLGIKGAMHFVPGPGNTEVSTSVTHPSQQSAQLPYWRSLPEYTAFIFVLWSSKI